MKDRLIIIKQEIIRELLALNNAEWHTVQLTFDFPPYLNKGYSGSQNFKDQQGNRVRVLFYGDHAFDNNMYDFIAAVNQQGNCNQVVFTAQRDQLDGAEISVGFKQEIENDFQNNLPKSKRGKTIPWWKLEASE
ncbi:MAG TPA: hypothetical protein VD794_09510 [Flavisolibacter sp.]|nr:hypothetical protein [Flavisolibacter sp.]